MKRRDSSDAPAIDDVQVIEAWLAGDGVKMRPLGTQRAYRRAIGRWRDFLAQACVDAPHQRAMLWTVNSDTARMWREDLLKRKRNQPATVNQLLSSVSSFYKFAISNHLAPAGFCENPFHRHALRVRVNAYDKARILTTAEYRQLMNHLNSLSNTKSHLRAHTMIRVLLHTGWRARELLAMRAGDLRPSVSGGGGMRYRCELPEGGFVDHLPADCVALMEEYLDVVGRPLATLAPDAYIWTPVRAVNMAGLDIEHDMSVPVHPGSVLRMVRTYLRDAGIDDYASISLRDIRHTHASILHEGGATMEMIRKRMRYERKESAERFVKSVLGAGDVDDVSAYFRALRKEPNEKQVEEPKRQHRSGKDT